jgi:putative Mn2+ efflux pump MntP
VCKLGTAFAQTCGKHVPDLGHFLNMGISAFLYSVLTPLFGAIIHSLFITFISVSDQFMPTIHSTNNKHSL